MTEHRKLRAVAWMELLLSVPLIALLVWPFSGFCSGRALGLDCESWSIFGVNFFGPIGLLALVCSTWTLWKNSPVPQAVLAVGVTTVVLYAAFHLL